MKAATTTLTGLLAASLLAASAGAANISMSITQTVEVREGQLAALVQINNSGDEAAHAVTPVLRFRDEEVRGKVRPLLGPDESYEELLTLPVGELGEGRWPFATAVDYTDANQYPFQALQVAAAVVGSPPPVRVALPRIDSAGVAGTGDVEIRVKNLSDKERKVRLEVFVAEGLAVEKPVQETTLGAFEEKRLDASIANQTAIAGSRYPVYVSVEYDEDGVHQALVAEGGLPILEADLPAPGGSRYLWIGAAVLGLFFVVLVASRFLRR